VGVETTFQSVALFTKDETSQFVSQLLHLFRVMGAMGESALVLTGIFVRAPLHCVPAAKVGLPGAAARKPAAHGNVFLMLLRHDSAALARAARVGLSAKSCPDTCLVFRRQMGRMESLQNVAKPSGVLNFHHS
jgi:hypothetical protein